MSDPEVSGTSSEDALDPGSFNSESILLSIKKNLNLPPSRKEFDQDIILHINSAFAKLNQMGIGPEVPVEISDEDDEWSLFYTDPKYNMVRTYMYLTVRLLFDPPSTTTMYEAFQRKIDESEYRLYILADEENVS